MTLRRLLRYFMLVGYPLLILSALAVLYYFILYAWPQLTFATNEESYWMLYVAVYPPLFILGLSYFAWRIILRYHLRLESVRRIVEAAGGEAFIVSLINRDAQKLTTTKNADEDEEIAKRTMRLASLASELGYTISPNPYCHLSTQGAEVGSQSEVRRAA